MEILCPELSMMGIYIQARCAVTIEKNNSNNFPFVDSAVVPLIFFHFDIAIQTSGFDFVTCPNLVICLQSVNIKPDGFYQKPLLRNENTSEISNSGMYR